MILYVVVVLIQLFIVLFIAMATGHGHKITHALTSLKVIVLYHAMATKSMVEDAIYRRREVVISCGEQTGRVAVVTGGGRGLGFHITRGLVQRGLRVILGVRNPDKCKDLVNKFKSENLSGTLEILQLDTSSLESVKKFAEDVKNQHKEINILVNNAGIIFGQYEESVDGFELKLATNYLGHFMLCHLLFDCLERAGRAGREASRIVNVSSSAHGATNINFEDINMKEDYIRLAAYAQSKLAQLMFSRHLNTLLSARSLPVKSFALHPGVVASGMAEDWKSVVNPLVQLFFKSEERGAECALFCSLDETITDPDAFFSDCRPCWTTAQARDQLAQRKLFRLTCSMLGIHSFGEKLQPQ